MAFWDKVSGELKKAAKEGWSAVKEGARVASEKGEEVAKVGKLRYKAYTTNKDAEKLFTELGGAVYDLAKPPYENPLSNDEVMRLVDEIKKIEAETARVETEMEEARKRAPKVAKPESAPKHASPAEEKKKKKAAPKDDGEPKETKKRVTKKKKEKEE